MCILSIYFLIAIHVKAKMFVKRLPKAMKAILSFLNRRKSRNRQGPFEGNTGNSNPDKYATRFRKEATLLRDQAATARKELQNIISCLEMAGNPGSDLGQRQLAPNVDQLCREELMHSLRKDMDDVNNAIRTLNMFLVQCSVGGFAEKYFTTQSAWLVWSANLYFHEIFTLLRCSIFNIISYYVFVFNFLSINYTVLNSEGTLLKTMFFK